MRPKLGIFSNTKMFELSHMLSSQAVWTSNIRHTYILGNKTCCPNLLRILLQQHPLMCFIYCSLNLLLCEMYFNKTSDKSILDVVGANSRSRMHFIDLAK